ncbi:putative f-box domain-containing protein [Erysiphe neolycopersici]|uniref:Putative f-box domain-containing protein n=1 Tax=Erysiphe neolycopersici TaxID=212602 RepID=A0A420HGJ1_9PEZI|nr:putative f-box domain-containing protein [Erysiphe neolycopersici]
MISKDPIVKNPELAPSCSAFKRLPDEIIVQILLQSDPDGFASLVLVNRRWRQVSSRPYLYSHQLSRCPSYSSAHQFLPIPKEDDLQRLRSLFAREIKRNLFEAYLRPNETIINIVTNTNSTFSTLDRDFFQYSLSPHGNYILAYSSTQIHVLDATNQEITVTRGFKILQRPTSTTITDDGFTLAVFSTDLQVDIYDLSEKEPIYTRAIILDHTPRTIALSPDGSVLAAAYDAGIEVSSLKPSNNSTDRRSVKCYTVDSLNFSCDGTQILGTTTHAQNPSTVVLTAPFFDTGATLQEDSVSALWTTSILFPNGSRDCSHAVLLPNSEEEEEANWAFTYDRVFETFRAVRIDDLRNGTTYFTGPVSDSSIGSKLLPSSLPAANKSGDLVASAFDGSIWLYGIPKNLEANSNSKENIQSSTESGTQPNIGHSAPNNSASYLNLTNRQNEEVSKIPQWQHLGDRARNAFVEGRKISFFQNVSDLTWVKSPNLSGDRLVAVASRASSFFLADEDKNTKPVDTGQIMILDFDHVPSNGKRRFITINVDIDNSVILDRENYGLETEVTRIRMRNLAQQGSRSHVVQRESEDTSNSFLGGTQNDQNVNHQTDSISMEEEVFDTPYSHTSPRSGSTLRRAATAAAINRRLNSQMTSNIQTIEYRRADGQEDYPHGSDADDWIPPPPPYSRNSITIPSEHIQEPFMEINILNDLPLFLNQDTNEDFCSNVNIDTCHEGQNAMSIIIDGSYREDTLQQQNSFQLIRESQYRESSIHNNEFDDRYDVSPAATPPPGSPKSTADSPNPLEGVTEVTTVNESAVRPYNKYKVGSELSSIFDRPGPPRQHSTQTCHKTLPYVTPLVTRSNKGTHSESQSFQNKNNSNISAHQEIPWNTTQRLEKSTEGHSMKFPLSNKFFSVRRTIRERTPKMLRRSTAPEATEYASQLLDQSRFSSNNNNLLVRLNQYRHLSENNIQYNWHDSLQGRETLSDSFYFSSHNTSSYFASSQSYITPRPDLNDNQELYSQLGDCQVMESIGSQTSQNPHQTNSDNSSSIILSKKIDTGAQMKIPRKSLSRNIEGSQNTGSLLGLSDFESNLNHTINMKFSSQGIESKKKKCTLM